MHADVVVSLSLSFELNRDSLWVKMFVNSSIFTHETDYDRSSFIPATPLNNIELNWPSVGQSHTIGMKYQSDWDTDESFNKPVSELKGTEKKKKY